ncbi:hypothetical protein SAMN04515671_4025 [Nakamurella panacisegetis]|uniref:Septum formation n=1 Tax=Nakamurella panacisegetis TaxID=1090615 RepID=A0A1H0SCD7_9ACTN|nr:hypothetical protein [Nakamurella panacisegetis]SDP39347.1 hypothetical protein SAMN04515671_4025 [Nakamurella panacisegetis]
MDRRLGGLVLLILACLSLLVVPNLRGRPLAGSATAVYLPPAPRVGQCVTALSPVPQGDSREIDPMVEYPDATYGPCRGYVVGEVMSVQAASLPAPRVPLSRYEEASSECELAEVNYVGSIGPFDLTDPNVPSIAWQAAVTIASIPVGPNRLQQGIGQTWTACVGATSDNTRYTGRIADALTRGVLPPTFATCWGAVPAATRLRSDSSVRPCAAPHTAEILATTQITDPLATDEDVQRTCRKFAARAMRTADPTGGGAITIAAYSMDGTSVMPLAEVELTAGYLGCLATVTPPRQLIGTLIGLGDHAVPIIPG